MLIQVCLWTSVPDLGELLQRPLGHKDPGRFHRGEAPRSGAHHRGGTGPDL